MTKIDNRSDIEKMILDEIRALPKIDPSSNKEEYPRHHIIGLMAFGGSLISDIAYASINIISVISALITVGEFTYKHWKAKRSEAIKKTQKNITDSNRICTEEDAERIIMKAFEMMGVKYPTMETEQSEPEKDIEE